MNTLAIAGVAVIAVALGIFVGWRGERLRLERARATAEEEAARIRSAAEQDADWIRQDAELAGREAAFKAKEAWEREEARRRDEIQQAERRLEQRREALDLKFDQLATRDEILENRERELDEKLGIAESRATEYEHLTAEVTARLEAIAGMTAEEARKQLIQEEGDRARAEAANLVREIKERARSEEHTSELQSRGHLVCRLLLEKTTIILRCICTNS